eukprot:2096459-Rhodomonas_salina.1
MRVGSLRSAAGLRGQRRRYASAMPGIAQCAHRQIRDLTVGMKADNEAGVADWESNRLGQPRASQIQCAG